MAGRKAEIGWSPCATRLEIIAVMLAGPEERAALVGELASGWFRFRAGRRRARCSDRGGPHLSMEQIAEAHGAMERNENFGKLVIEIR